ncbi:MAG: DNA gyrase subunit A [Candidatus Micrarchaeia archaeon]
MAESIDTPIEKEMQDSYIDYAMSVIVGRALPDARDGLKPAQRRVLYAMYKLNNVHSQPTKKSARVVGEVIGRYHPHGDMAVYDTLVRLAQDFSMNHMLVEGQGNMGSIDGDPPAAQRYTEVRLRKIAEEMLEDIEKDSVPMVPNFDNTEIEPVVLPSKIPNLLINGSSGIAVGVATNILPHNLAEVCDAIIAYVKDRNINNEGLLEYIKGPDFPTGGTVFYDSRLLSSYLTGRGAVTIRGKAEIEEEGNSKRIVIKEIPYTVNKAMLVENMVRLIRDKKIIGVSDLRDESDKKGIRITIDLKKDANPDYILNLLYAHTQLQVSLPVMNIAVLDNSLLTMKIKDFIKAFVEHRFKVITNRTKYDLNIATDRMHIVDGLITAVENIDNVVALIRGSADIKAARQSLMGSYGLSEKQANAVLDMKLSKLTNLEITTLRSEKEELTRKISEYNGILADNEKVYGIIIEETEYVKQHYGIARRTAIESSISQEIMPEDLVEDKETTILLTNRSYAKRLDLGKYRVQDRGGKGIKAIELKEGDYVKQTLICRAKDTLLLVTNTGRAYWLKAYAVPEGDRYSTGKAAANLITTREGESIAKMINTRDMANLFIVFLTKKGIMKRVRAELFSRPRSNGINAVQLKDGDSIADVAISDGNSGIFIATRNGKAIHFKESEIRPMGRMAAGVRAIRLKPGDEPVNMVVVKDQDSILSVTDKGYGKVTSLERYRQQHRGGGGILNLRVNEKTGHVAKALKVNDDDNVLLINSKGISIQFPVSEVRKTGRAASGVRMMRMDHDTNIIDAQVVSTEKQDGSTQ